MRSLRLAARALLCLCTLTVLATAAEPPATIADKTRGLEKMDGLIPLYWDAQAGKLYLELSRFREELIYFTSLPAGMGSNDIGLDRGQLGREAVVFFDRIGVGSSRVDLQACKLEYSIVSPK